MKTFNLFTILILLSISLFSCKKNGLRQEFDEDGSIKYEMYFIDGELNGESKEFYKDSKIKRIWNFKNSKRHGPCTTFYENGNILSIKNFVNDTIHGENYQFNCGRIKSYNVYNMGVVIKSKISDKSTNRVLQFVERNKIFTYDSTYTSIDSSVKYVPAFDQYGFPDDSIDVSKITTKY